MRIDILNLDILARDWVADGAPVLAGPALRRRDMVLRLVVSLVLVQLPVDLGVAVLFLLVQALDELLDVGDPVAAGVVLPGRVDLFLGVHPSFLI